MALSLPRDVTLVETADGVVLLDQRKGVYWQLNRAGAEALRMMLGGTAPGAVADNLARDFPVASHRALADVENLLTALTRAHLVVVS